MTGAEALQVLGIVPARGGSKGVPGKNSRLMAGLPLVSYTFAAAKSSRLLTRVLLSTDSREIAGIGAAEGVAVPFLRPADLAADASPMVGVIRHALDWLWENEGYRPDVVVLLQPTTPLRRPADIDGAVELLLRSGADACVSVCPVPGHFSPHWQFRIEGDELQVFTGEPLAHLVPRRQELPVTYTRNGAVYAFRREAFEETGSIYGRRCVAYVMPEEVSVNIDSMDDWVLAEARIQAREGRGGS